MNYGKIDRMKRNIKYLTKKANNKCFNSNLSGRKAKAENKLLDYEEIISECTKDERNQHVKVSFMLAAEKQLYSKALIHAVEGQYFIAGVCVSQVHTVYKNVQKRASQVLTYQKPCISRCHVPKNVQKGAKTCISSTYLPKNVHLKVSFTKKRAKTCKERAKTCKNVQKRAS